MNEVKEFLSKNDVQFFATVGLDGKPKVRPFQFMLEEDGKYYFCTSNKKPVFEEIKKQPYVEVCCSSPDFSWLRLKGKVVFSRDMALKGKIQDASPLVKSIYKTPDNPDFEIFYLDEAEATIADFSGNPARTFRL
ncbi:pyridoxamine 5'-phosphate oxidase family protein [Brucepastera parasyntrophica]|uniref:pyridoxamine 5'-phosphate oxidase family protein n=1 Tax=Brucepastera parasyntrophica TaxID=2880008 RepID=UPI00210E3928|nr:pyridoxamine 5'-phosphate oxidase family protein [Brucepastera parasyntrophica]ULQ60979.1 pyridoxamine 5'-phosphate oxidase family protein [Brucepastera parasyntrophica]